MARPTIDQVRGLGDFATLYQWSISFSKSPAAHNFDNTFDLRMVSTEVPKITNEPIDIRIRGHHIKQPGISDSTHTITLTAQETVDNYITEGLMQWRNACAATQSGVQGANIDVKADLLLQRLDRQDNIIWVYSIRGCFLEDYDPTGGELGAEVGLVTPSITLSYDYFLEGASAPQL